MAAVEVTISGMLYDKLNRTTQNVVLIGEATLTGLSVGGGPMPPGPGGGGGSPPGIWGPNDPRPTPPIAFPPGWVGGVPPGQPPTIWPNPPEGIAPHPEHPIVIPPVPPATEPQWALKAVWVPQVGWVSVIVPVGDQPIPTPSS